MHLSTSGYYQVDAKGWSQPEEMLKGSLQWTSSNNTSRPDLFGGACSTAVFTIVELSIQFETNQQNGLFNHKALGEK